MVIETNFDMTEICYILQKIASTLDDINSSLGMIEERIQKKDK